MKANTGRASQRTGVTTVTADEQSRRRMMEKYIFFYCSDSRTQLLPQANFSLSLPRSHDLQPRPRPHGDVGSPAGPEISQTGQFRTVSQAFVLINTDKKQIPSNDDITQNLTEDSG